MRSHTNKIGRNVGALLIILLALLLGGSSALKFAHVPKVVAEFKGMGFEGRKLDLVAALEIVSTVLFLVPVTRSIGLLLISAYLGGAIATHLQHNQSPVPPAIMLSLIWLATSLRHPAVLWSLAGKQCTGDSEQGIVKTQIKSAQ